MSKYTYTYTINKDILRWTISDNGRKMSKGFVSLLSSTCEQTSLPGKTIGTPSEQNYSMGVSINGGTFKSSNWIGFSRSQKPSSHWDTPILGNPHLFVQLGPGSTIGEWVHGAYSFAYKDRDM